MNNKRLECIVTILFLISFILILVFFGDSNEFNNSLANKGIAQPCFLKNNYLDFNLL